MSQEPSRFRILAVDDEEPVLQIVALVLRKAGYDVECFTDARSGLDELSRQRYDLVVTDRAMPGMTGDDLARLAKAAHPTLKVLMLTGTGHHMIQARETPSGVDRVIGKPVRRQDLLGVVAEMLGVTSSAP